VGKDGGLTIAIVVLSASTARHHADPAHWTGELEKALALSALAADNAAFERAATRAAKIVETHRQEIAAES